MKHAFPLSAVLVCTCLALPAFGGTGVHGSHLKALIPGFHGQGKDFTVSYARNGHVTIKEGAHLYKGVWTIRKNAVCSQFKALHNGAEQCRRVEKIDATHYRFSLVGSHRSYVLTTK